MAQRQTKFEGFLTLNEVVASLPGVTRKRLYDDIRAGRLAASQMPVPEGRGAYYLRPEAVEEYKKQWLTPQPVTRCG